MSGDYYNIIITQQKIQIKLQLKTVKTVKTHIRESLMITIIIIRVFFAMKMQRF